MAMLTSRTLYLLMSACLVAGQRPSFAGFKPIGYPDLQNKTNTDDLGNRFGDDGEPLPLPVEAKGDRDLVNRISKLPIDKQPFWYINWKALEEHRRNPQTYEQRPNVFVDPITSNTANRNQVNTANFDTSQVDTANINRNEVNTVNSNFNNQAELSSKFNTENNQSAQVETQAQAQGGNHLAGRRHSHRHY